MRKTMTLVLAALTAAALLMPVTAAADTQLDFSVDAVSVLPDEGGRAEVTINVANLSGETLSDLAVLLPDGRGAYSMPETAGEISANQVFTDTVLMDVAEEEMEKPLVFEAEALTLSGKRIQQYAILIFEKESDYTGDDPEPEEEEPPAQTSPTQPGMSQSLVFESGAAQDGTVFVSATFRNTGNVDLHDVRLCLSPIADSAEEGGASVTAGIDLEAGATRVVRGSVPVTETVTVTPIVRYVWAGQHFKNELEPVTLRASSQIDTELLAETQTPAPGYEDSVTLRITNSTGAALSELSAVDARGVYIPLTTRTLGAGESTEVTFLQKFYSPQTFCATVSGVAGDSVYVGSDSFEVTPVFAEGSELVTLTASSDITEAPSATAVNVTVTVANTSGYELFDVTVAGPDGTLGIRRSLAAQETMEFTYTADIAESTTLGFTVKALDIIGDTVEGRAFADVKIVAPEPTAAPLLDIMPTDSAQIGKMGTLLLIAACVLFVVIVVLVIVFIRMGRKFIR